jgi:hypothetical protein
MRSTGTGSARMKKEDDRHAAGRMRFRTAGIRHARRGCD